MKHTFYIQELEWSMDFNPLTFIDLFAGIGGMRLGFEAVGGRCVFSSDWDADAQRNYALNFGETPHGDITEIASTEIPDHDVLLAWFPCQPFSIIGDKQGFADTRGTLFFEIERILKDKQPQSFLLENVKQLRSHDKGRTFQVIQQQLEALGYFIHSRVLNTLDFGLPQKRERIFIVGFRKNYEFEFPSGTTQRVPLDDILEPEHHVDDKWYASDYISDKRQASVAHKAVFYPSVWHENKGGNISVLPYSCALRAGASFNYLLVNGKRRLTPREQLRLQGFPEHFMLDGSESTIRKLTGNSVSVPVIEAIAKQMVKAMFEGRVTEQSNPLPMQLSLWDIANE